MPVSAATLKKLIEAGLAGDTLLEVVAHIDADNESYLAAQRPVESPVDTTAERRRAYDRERKAAQRAGEKSGGKSTGTSGGKSGGHNGSLNDYGSLLLTSESSLNPPTPLPPSSPSLFSFARFWEAYPHKVGKGAAERSFDRVRKSGKVAFAELMAGLERYKATKPAEREWCNPATWLNQRRWEDKPAINGAQTAVVLVPNHGDKDNLGRVYLRKDTPQFEAWGGSLTDKHGGWWFPSEWPPQQAKANA